MILMGTKHHPTTFIATILMTSHLMLISSHHSPPVLNNGYYIMDMDGQHFDLLNLALCYSWPLPGPDPGISELIVDEDNSGELNSGFKNEGRTNNNTGRGRDILIYKSKYIQDIKTIFGMILTYANMNCNNICASKCIFGNYIKSIYSNPELICIAIHGGIQLVTATFV